MPLSAKLRVLADLWKKPLPGEPTVSAWVAHRFGKALLPFADAVFTGTYAGDIDRLKIDAVMPGVRKLEQEHGSVIRGLLHKRKTMKTSDPGKRPVLPAMTSFQNGMSRLPQALAAGLQLNNELFYRTEVTRISPVQEGWEVQTTQHSIRCRHLVLALPVNRTLTLLDPVSEVAAPPLREVPEVRIATVALGFTDKAQVPFGFGYLAPESEKRFALGTLFSSHMFPGRAPRGHILLEALVGGRRHPERLDLDDEELIKPGLRGHPPVAGTAGKTMFCQGLASSRAVSRSWRRGIRHYWIGSTRCTATMPACMSVDSAGMGSGSTI